MEIPKEARRRLQIDYMELIKSPLPYITARPTEHNILLWHFIITGAIDSPYSGGIYQGTLEFPNEFPYKPPAIRMLTPNGRFKTNKRICLSISDYHPELWSPLWTVSAILNGVYSFMLEDTHTAGCLQGISVEEKQKMAEHSWTVNLNDDTFCQLFPDFAEQARLKLRKKYLSRE